MRATGTVHDIIHARVFWNSQLAATATLGELIAELDKKPETAKLHGAAFFVRVGPDESLSEVEATMDRSGAVVGIVVDEKGKPADCFTKPDLVSSQK